MTIWISALLTLLGSPNTSPDRASAPVPIAPPTYVEFDFTPLPETVGRKWSLTFKVTTTQEDAIYSDKIGPVEGYLERHALCVVLMIGLDEKGYKTEVINKSKIRVYGRTVEGKFYPVVKGIVTSDELMKDELPTIASVKE